MPLGYVKGQTYCQNWDFDRYAAMPIFRLLSDYARKLKLSLHFTYSHITRAYDCEIRQICYFKHSGNPYWLGLANRGGDTPIEALINALSVAAPSTPLLQVLILEAQCVLLGEDLERSRKLEGKIDRVLEVLRRVLDSIPVGVTQGDKVVCAPVPLGTLRGKKAPVNPLQYNEGDTAEDEEWRYTMRRDPGYYTDDDL